jgi:hypothetical protein
MMPIEIIYMLSLLGQPSNTGYPFILHTLHLMAQIYGTYPLFSLVNPLFFCFFHRLVKINGQIRKAALDFLIIFSL